MNTIPNSEELTFEKVWTSLQETFKSIREMSKETDRKFQDTDRKFQETDKKMDKMLGHFNSQWGKLVESLVEGDLIRLLNARNIPVNQTIERAKGCFDGENYEYDIIAVNGDEIVVVEVKTTLRNEDVVDFKKQLVKLKQRMPRYADCKVYGAMAYLKADGKADVQAEKKGFFVIRATGNSACITNAENFIPVQW